MPVMQETQFSKGRYVISPREVPTHPEQMKTLTTKTTEQTEKKLMPNLKFSVPSVSSVVVNSGLRFQSVALGREPVHAAPDQSIDRNHDDSHHHCRAQ